MIRKRKKMRVTNIWELKVPVTIEHGGKKYVIPHDGMVYFLPDTLRGDTFKGLLRVVPDNVPLKKHYPKQFNIVQDPKTGRQMVAPPKAPEPKEAFPEFIYKEPDFSEFANCEPPQNPDYFPTYVRDKDDPDVLVQKELTLDEKREEVKSGDKPLKGIRVDKKVRNQMEAQRIAKVNKRKAKKVAEAKARNFGEPI